MEQVGCSNDHLYRLMNSEQLDSDEELVSAVASADDVALLLPSFAYLEELVKLTEMYCQKYFVTLLP